jgi:hypothetical protein
MGIIRKGFAGAKVSVKRTLSEGTVTQTVKFSVVNKGAGGLTVAKLEEALTSQDKAKYVIEQPMELPDGTFTEEAVPYTMERTRDNVIEALTECYGHYGYVPAPAGTTVKVPKAKATAVEAPQLAARGG